MLDSLQCEEGDHTTRDHRCAGENVNDEGLGLGIARVQQDEEIAHLLRYLVGNYRDRGHNAQFVTGEKSSCDQNTVDEIVESVADPDHQTAAAMIMMGRKRRIVCL